MDDVAMEEAFRYWFITHPLIKPEQYDLCKMVFKFTIKLMKLKKEISNVAN